MSELKPFTGKGSDGWTILQSEDCIKLRHDASNRVFTLIKSYGEYWEIYAANPKIDGPRSEGPIIAKISGLRNALLAVGFLRS